MRIQLPQGPSYDSYLIRLFVQISDDLNGITRYDLPTPITVQPDPIITNQLIQAVLSNDMTTDLMQRIKTGSLQSSTQAMNSFTSAINALTITNIVNTSDV